MERAGLVHIRYSPKDDRILFAMPDRVGFMGRALEPGIKPKWRAYGDTRGVFLAGSYPTLVLVEDAASACSVASCGDLSGGALLGTNISAYQKSIIKRFERVIIALDQDASSKAFKLKGKLQGMVPTTVRFLRQDLKYLEPEKIREIIYVPSPA